jgi:HSP20 family protein
LGPFGDLEELRERMQRFFEGRLGPWPPFPPLTFLGWPPAVSRLGWSPLVDVEETDDAYFVEADVPGAKRDDISVELEGNELHIAGEVKERQKAGIVRRRTRRTGRFDYRVSLPETVDPDRVEATLSEGVLTVRVSKREPSDRHRIEITDD